MEENMHSVHISTTYHKNSYLFKFITHYIVFPLPSVRTLAGKVVYLVDVTWTFIPEWSKSPMDLPFLFAFLFLITFTDEHWCSKEPTESQGFQTIPCCCHGEHTHFPLVIACCFRDKCPLAWQASSFWALFSWRHSLRASHVTEVPAQG